MSAALLPPAAWRPEGDGGSPAAPPPMPMPAAAGEPATGSNDPAAAAMRPGGETAAGGADSGSEVVAEAAPPAADDPTAMTMPGPDGDAAARAGSPAAERGAAAEGLAVGAVAENVAGGAVPLIGELKTAAVAPAAEAPVAAERAAEGTGTGTLAAARAAEQVAAALRATPDGRIELRLAPEELGPVRLELSPGDGAITVELAAERGETLDLLRRHADALARELRQAGYGEVRLQFGGGGFGDGASPRHFYAPAGGGDGEAGATDGAPAAAPRNLSRTLDLRL